MTDLFFEGLDVTEAVRAREQVLRLQSELLHFSPVSAMGTMASALAHELNQPLTACTNDLRGSLKLIEIAATRERTSCRR